MLSHWTCEVLLHRSDISADEANREGEAPEDLAAWEAVHEDCEAALAGGTLSGHPLAAAELVNYLSGNMCPGESHAINRDLARGGHLDRSDPDAVFLGSRPRTITVGGVKYETA